MQLVAWVALCFALSILLRRRPAILVAISLGVWVVVPSVASSVITNIDTGSLSFAPSTWLIITTLIVQVLYDARTILWEVGHRILVYLALVLVILVTFLATKTSPGGSGLVLFVDQIAAPVALFVVACAAFRSRPADLIMVRNVIVGLAAVESLVTIAQWMTHSIIFYRVFFDKTYWFNELTYTRWMGTTDQPLTLSFLICVAVPLVAGIRRVVIQMPLLLVLAIGVVITQSRTGVAIVGVGIVYVILTSRARAIAKVLSLLAMSVAGFLVLTSSLSAGVAARVGFDQGSAVARSDAINYFFDHWLEYFFTGGGISLSYRFAELGGLQTSLESSILMYAIDIGVVFSLLYFGVQLVIVLRSAARPGCPGLFLAGIVVVVIPQTYSALATGSLAGVLLWTVLAMAASLPRRIDVEPESVGDAVPPPPEPPETLIAPPGQAMMPTVVGANPAQVGTVASRTTSSDYQRLKRQAHRARTVQR